MENQKKKLRLEDIQVESFVTSVIPNSQTVQGGSLLNGGCSGGTTITPIFDGPGSGGWRRDDGGGSGGWNPVRDNVIDTINDPRFGTIVNKSCEFGDCVGGTGRSNNHPDPNVYCS